MNKDTRSTVDSTTLAELGLKTLTVGEITLYESCAKSPTILISQDGEVVTILKYNELRQVVEFIQDVLGR